MRRVEINEIIIKKGGEVSTGTGIHTLHSTPPDRRARVNDSKTKQVKVLRCFHAQSSIIINYRAFFIFILNLLDVSRATRTSFSVVDSSNTTSLQPVAILIRVI